MSKHLRQYCTSPGLDSTSKCYTSRARITEKSDPSYPRQPKTDDCSFSESVAQNSWSLIKHSNQVTVHAIDIIEQDGRSKQVVTCVRDLSKEFIVHANSCTVEITAHIKCHSNK